MSDRLIHYANPEEIAASCFEFHFGAYQDTTIRVYAPADHYESALEIAAEWLAEHEPGHLIEDWGDEHRTLYNEAVKELYPNTLEADLTNEQRQLANEQATADLTYTECGWLISYEWTVHESPADTTHPAPHFDRFDIAEATYVYWSEHHTGQFSDGYRQMCRASKLLNDSPKAHDFESLSENGQAIYRKIAKEDRP